jgi:hypothetical protein
MINLRKFSTTLEVNPADAYDVDLVLGPCPDDDRHRALKPKADLLRNNGYEPDEAAEMLRAWLTRPEKYSGEVSDTVERSWAEWQELVIVGGKSGPKNIKPDCQKVVELFREYGGWKSLQLYLILLDYKNTGKIRYPSKIEDMTTREWLSRMYQPSDLLCLGWHMEETTVLPLDTILYRYQYSNQGTNEERAVRRFNYRLRYYCLMTPATYQMELMHYKDRNWGRCDLNILRRKYWCIEMDISEKQKKGHWKGVLPRRDYDGFDLQAGVIRQLFELGFPIVSIVHSGNKSLHVWCSGAGLSNEDIEMLITSVIHLGADPASRGLSQFMRVPNPDHPLRPQYCYYFDPKFVNND